MFEVAELLTMMSTASTAHDVTKMDKDVDGATKLYGVALRHGEGWIWTGLKWLEYLETKKDKVSWCRQGSRIVTASRAHPRLDSLGETQDC